MQTPYFLINKNLLNMNVQDFLSGMEKNWKNSCLSYSVKTNSLPWLLKYLISQGLMMEVVSDEEYELALYCGCKYENIVFNGPIKTKERFIESVKNGSFVNIDSSRELDWVRENILNSDRLGLRINVPTDIFKQEDVDYTETGFRFGFSELSGDISRAIRTMRDTGNQRFGLHLHCNSITRSPEVYRAITRYVVELVERYELLPSFIDIGGGFFGGVPGKTTPYEYFNIISEELGKSQRTKDAVLIAEPGSAIIGSTVDLITSVLDVKDTSKSRIVTTDGSRIHIDPLWIKKNHMYSLEAKSASILNREQVICGYTCMDHDRIMAIDDEPELCVGDKIIYHRVGAYSMTFGGLFIRYLPDVYVKDGTQITIVRRKIEVKDYMTIEGV